MLRRCRAATAAATCLALACAVHADEAAPVRAAVEALYRALAAGEADKLAALLPPGGFTEFSPPERVLKVLDVAFFRQALASGVRIDLRVEQPRIDVRDDSAVVTGYRVGSIDLADGTRVDLHDCMTMVWNHDRNAWKLHHVHISECRS